MINEISQGGSGIQEYIEFIVLGSPSDPTAPVDLTGYIIDDNNFAGSGTGTAPGHARLGDCYDAVPPGSILVLYNASDVNGSLPPSDPEDSDGDGVYIIPHSSPCLSMCEDNPSAVTSEFHCPCSNFGSNTWFVLGMRNGGDLVQVRDGCSVLHHVVMYGSQLITTEVDGSPVYVNTGFGSQSGRVIWFDNSSSDDWLDPNNFSTGPVASNETPGAPNNADNEAWIQSIADGSYPYDGEIASCRKTDAGSLEWPADGDPGPGNVLEICEGEDISAFSPDWSGGGQEEPDPALFDFEYGYVLSEPDPPYVILDYNLSGDFDFSTLAPGSYRVWGVSFLYVNGEEDFMSFMADACIADVETIEDYEACDYDCGIDVNVTNLSTYSDEVLIEIIPAPDDPTDPMIGPLCESEAADYDLTDLIDIINDGSGLMVVFYDGEPGNGGTEIADPTSADLNGVDLWIEYGDAPCTIIFDLTDPDITSGPTLDPIGPFTLCIPSGASTIDVDLTQYHPDLNADPGITFEWYEDAALLQPIGNPSNYTISTGSTTVYVQGDDGGCLSNIQAVEFSVFNSPDIATGLSLEGCEPAPDNFDLTELEPDLNANPAFTFNWFENPDGSGTISNPADYASSGGDIYVSVTDPASGCTSDTVSVELILNPEPDFDVINDVTVCEGLEVDLDTVVDPSNPNLSYTFHDGFPPNTGNQIMGTTSFNSNTTIWVVGTDDDTGCSSIEEVNVDVIDIPVTPPISNSGPYCEGETIELSYDFPIPIPGLQFSWTGPNGFSSSNEDPTILNAPPAAAGEYNLVVSLLGCSSQPAVTAVVVTPLPVINPETPIEICEGEPLNLSADGPAGTQYNWSGPNGFSSTDQNPTVTSSATPADAGDYFVSGTLNGCAGPDTLVEVSVFAGPEIDLTITSELSCAGDTDGALSVTVTSGPPPYDYVWSNPTFNGQSDLDDLPSGTYSVTVTDGNGCTNEAEVELTEPDAINLFCTEISSESFPGAEDGIGGVDISGGTSPYDLVYDNNDGTDGVLIGIGAGTTEIEDLPAGTYDVVVTDANGCEATCSFTITDPGCDVEIPDIEVIAGVNCFGDSTAIILAQIMGGSGTYVYTWTNSNGDFVGATNPLNDLPADIYTLTVADAFDLDCERNIQIEVTEPEPLLISCEILSEVSAPGAGDGEIQISFEGGTGNYDLNINGIQTPNVSSPLIIDTLSPGTYDIEIVDENGCINECSLTLSPADCDLEITAFTILDSLQCLGDSIGRATAQITGGPTGDYSFLWRTAMGTDTLSQTDTVSDLSSGLYELIVQDDNCQVSDTFRISENENALELLNCEILNPVSAPGNADGSVQVSWTGGIPVMVAGGPPSYSLEISGPRDTTIQVVGLSYLFDSLPAGTYEITLQDSIPCTQSCTFTLTDIPCDLDIELDTAFFDGCPSDSSLTIRLNPNPLDSHTLVLWNTDTVSVAERTGLPAGNYLIQYVDTLTGCWDSLLLDYPAPPAADLNCFVVENPSEAGMEDGALGFSVDQIATPYEARLTGPQDRDSSGLETDSLIWTNLGEGSYTITIIDSLGCNYSCALNLTSGACVLDIELDTAFFDGCPSDSSLFIRFTASDTTQHTIFLWNSDTLNQLEQSNLPPGSYQIIALDTLSLCSDTLQLDQPDPSVLDFDCQVFSIPSGFGVGDGVGGVIIDSASQPISLTIAGFNYFNDVSGTLSDTIAFEDLDSGTYIITIENSFGCVDTCSFFMPNGGCGIFSIDSIVPTPATCAAPQSGQIEVFVSGGSGDYTFDWGVDSLRNQNPILNAEPGNYAVEVRDTTLGCLALGTTFLTSASDLNAQLLLPDTVCAGDSVTISVENLDGLPPYQIVLDGDPLIQIQSDTTFNILSYSGTIEINDSGTCSYSEDFLVPEAPVAQQLIDRSLCPGDNLVVGDSTFTQSNPMGMVRIPGGAANGCDSVVIVNLTFESLPVEFTLLPPDCSENLRTQVRIDNIEGSGPYRIRLNGLEETFENVPATFDGEIGSNSFTLTDATSCSSDTFSFTGEEVAPLSFQITGPNELVQGDTAQLGVTNSEGLSNFEWTPADILSCTDCPSPLAFPQVTTTIRLTAIDTNGCPGEAVFNLRILEAGEDIFIPDVFSPNGDGINDHFSLFAAPGSGTIQSLQIFDRWGNQLFERRNIPINAPTAGWDGRSNGDLLPPGVYVYSFQFLNSEGEVQHFKGSITLVQ
jgi:gliding motility-associated-like protein